MKALKVPTIAATTILVLGGAFYFVAGMHNRLDAAVFDSQAIGTAQSDVDAKLPVFQMLGNPDLSDDDCQRYWAAQPRDDRWYYRLCFADRRLVDKQVVPRKDVP